MNTLITNIGQLIAPAPDSSALRAGTTFAVQEHTELSIQGGRITRIGCSDPSEHVDCSIDARGGVVMPGLIDPHTHFVPEVRSDVTGAADSDHELPLGQAMHNRLRRALIEGVTTIEVKCRTLDELRDLSAAAHATDHQYPKIIATLCGAGPATGVPHAESMANLIADAIPTVRRRRLATFCDVECSSEAYSIDEARTILRAARAACLHLKLHGSGASVSGIGDVAAELGVSAIAYLQTIDRAEATVLGRSGVVPIFLPGAALAAGTPYPDAQSMREAGLAVGLGTNAGSPSPSVGSVWLVIALAVTALGMSLDQAITAATFHNAQAIEAAGEIGAADVGKQADLIVLDVRDYRELLCGLGENAVRLVIRDGEVVHQR